MAVKVKIKCNRCKKQATVAIVDSIPYCPDCGKPITPDEIYGDVT